MARTKQETVAERSELEELKSDTHRALVRIEDKIRELEEEERESPEDMEKRLGPVAAGEADLGAMMKRATMPKQKPGQSKQDYATPMELIRAVEGRWGPIVHDLCAHAQNARVASYYSKEQDCFKQSWSKDFYEGNLWGNPEFGGGFIEKFAQKCFEESRQRKGLIFMLTPASIGSEWFAKWVENKALVVGLRPRLSFDGINPYPKDCMLSVYGKAEKQPNAPSWFDYLKGFETWRWKK